MQIGPEKKDWWKTKNPLKKEEKIEPTKMEDLRYEEIYKIIQKAIQKERRKPYSADISCVAELLDLINQTYIHKDDLGVEGVEECLVCGGEGRLHGYTCEKCQGTRKISRPLTQEEVIEFIKIAIGFIPHNGYGEMFDPVALRMKEKRYINLSTGVTVRRKEG